MRRAVRILLGSLIVIVLATSYFVYWRNITTRLKGQEVATLKAQLVDMVKRMDTSSARQRLTALDATQKKTILTLLLDENDCKVKLFAVQELLQFKDDKAVKDALDNVSKGSDDCATSIRALLEQANHAKP
jgi:hypothetical protein